MTETETETIALQWNKPGQSLKIMTETETIALR
jgi:hypothetical protein